MSVVVPLGLHLSGRKCVVIGGGPVAARRAKTLLEGGATVVVVAPDVTDEIDALRKCNSLQVIGKDYSHELLEEAFLVVAATSDSEINTRVVKDARSAGYLVSDADDPDRGDCIFPAVVRRGDLVISVTTGGASPSLAAIIREGIEQEFGPEYVTYVALLGEMRSKAMGLLTNIGRRKRVLNALAADRDILELIRDGRLDEARAKADACISSSQD